MKPLAESECDTLLRNRNAVGTTPRVALIRSCRGRSFFRVSEHSGKRCTSLSELGLKRALCDRWETGCDVRGAPPAEKNNPCKGKAVQKKATTFWGVKESENSFLKRLRGESAEISELSRKQLNEKFLCWSAGEERSSGAKIRQVSAEYKERA